MARRLFPLVDILVGVSSAGPRLGAPALLPHGVRLDLFSDPAATIPADCRAVASNGIPDEAGGVLSHVFVEGVTIPRFYGPNDDTILTLYALPENAGAGALPFPIFARGITGAQGPIGPPGPEGPIGPAGTAVAPGSFDLDADPDVLVFQTGGAISLDDADPDVLVFTT